jgi:hypothetical protein
MIQRGKKSVASLGVVDTSVRGLTRLQAPSALCAEQKAIWAAAVNSKPADWFTDEHIPMLEAYTSHVMQKNNLQRMLDSFDLSWALEDEGLKRLEKLQKMHRVQTQAIENLMRAMRLTHQSQYRADKASTLDKSAKGKKPWQREVTVDNGEE